MTNPTPFPISVVRFAALTQALLTVVLAGTTAVLTYAGYVSDRADAAAGHPNEWAGLGEYVGVVVAGVFLGAALLVGLPALLLGPHRPGARVALILAEVVTATPIGLLLLASIGHDAGTGWLFLGALYVALAVVTVWLLFERPARRWSADRDCGVVLR